MSMMLLAGVLALTGMTAWAVSANNAAWKAFQASWQQWAAARGFEFVPPPPSFFIQSSPKLVGRVRDVAIEIDTYDVSTGKVSITYTRVRSHAQVPTAGLIEAHTKGALERFGEALGLKALHTGDAVFDSKFTVHAEPLEAMATLFDDDTRRAMVGLPVEAFSLRYFNGVTTLSWVGLCRDARVLDAACALAAAAGVWRRDPQLYR